MYFPFFLAYMGICFIITLVVFMWALKKGQFQDQDRARFLPLEDEPDAEKVMVTPFNRIEAYALIFLVIAGLASTVMVLLFSLFLIN
jgi:cbb3-type cytochrome oxidase maturation protein